jgi:LL-diaminopimelate aminotransferase
MHIEVSRRIKQLPPYIFFELDKIKQKAIQEGKVLYPLGIGDPDLPTPQFILDALVESAYQTPNQKYPSYVGKIEFRKAAAHYFEKRFGVTLDPSDQVLALIGSKEGIAHIPLAFIDPGQGVLIPDIGYPVYYSSTIFAGGDPVEYSLTEKKRYLPDFDELENLVQKHPHIKMMFLNYPNNPTAACANLDFFSDLVQFAKKHSILLCHDNAYSDIYFNNKKPCSLLQVPGALDVACEFHSLSKTFNMTGFRVGFVVGNPKVLEALTTIKTNIDSGVFNACQDAGTKALLDTSSFTDDLRAIYQQRRNILVPALQKIGLECRSPEATFYVWAKIPQAVRSVDYAKALIEKFGIICTPGTGFGRGGEGYVRFTLCSDASELQKVADLLEKS